MTEICELLWMEIHRTITCVNIPYGNFVQGPKRPEAEKVPSSTSKTPRTETVSEEVPELRIPATRPSVTVQPASDSQEESAKGNAETPENLPELRTPVARQLNPTPPSKLNDHSNGLTTRGSNKDDRAEATFSNPKVEDPSTAKAQEVEEKPQELQDEGKIESKEQIQLKKPDYLAQQAAVLAKTLQDFKPPQRPAPEIQKALDEVTPPASPSESSVVSALSDDPAALETSEPEEKADKTDTSENLELQLKRPERTRMSIGDSTPKEEANKPMRKPARKNSISSSEGLLEVSDHVEESVAANAAQSKLSDDEPGMQDSNGIENESTSPTLDSREDTTSEPQPDLFERPVRVTDSMDEESKKVRAAKQAEMLMSFDPNNVSPIILPPQLFKLALCCKLNYGSLHQYYWLYAKHWAAEAYWAIKNQNTPMYHLSCTVWQHTVQYISARIIWMHVTRLWLDWSISCHEQRLKLNTLRALKIVFCSS